MLQYGCFSILYVYICSYMYIKYIDAYISPYRWFISEVSSEQAREGGGSNRQSKSKCKLAQVVGLLGNAKLRSMIVCLMIFWVHTRARSPKIFFYQRWHGFRSWNSRINWLIFCPILIKNIEYRKQRSHTMRYTSHCIAAQPRRWESSLRYQYSSKCFCLKWNLNNLWEWDIYLC